MITMCEAINTNKDLQEGDMITLDISNICYHINDEDLEANEVETEEELLDMLPKEIIVEVEYTDDDDLLTDRINDAISDETGMLVVSYMITSQNRMLND